MTFCVDVLLRGMDVLGRVVEAQVAARGLARGVEGEQALLPVPLFLWSELLS